MDVHQGLMIDLCAGGVTFQVPANAYLQVGDQLWLRGAYPLLKDGAFGMTCFTAVGRVLRCDPMSPTRRRAAVRFDVPLEQRPAQVAGQTRLSPGQGRTWRVLAVRRHQAVL